MTVSFNQIPGNLRVPFAYFEVNPSQSPYQSVGRLLLIGQMTPTGVAQANRPIWVTGGAEGLFGPGSMLATMYAMAAVAAPFQEIWAIPLADAVGASKATGTIAFAARAPLAASGTIVLYIDGCRVAVPANTLMTNLNIATALAAAINACPNITVSAAATAGAAGTATYTILSSFLTGLTSTPTTLAVTANGVSYSIIASSADTPSTIAAKIVEAVDFASGLSASATGPAITFTAISNGVWANSTTIVLTPASGSPITVSLAGATNDVVTVTALNAGTIGNGCTIWTRLAPDDTALADQLCTITQMSGGAGDPNITAAITALGDGQFDYIVMPYAQTAYLDQLEAWLTNRWSPNSMTYGLNFTAIVNQTAGQVQAFTTTRNSQYSYIMPMNNSPQNAAKIAAVYGAVAAAHLQSPPELSRPLQTLPLPGIRPPKSVGDEWTIVQRQGFYYSGAGGYRVEPGNIVAIDRAVSTYQNDVYGNPDQSWLDVNTLAQLMYGIRYLKQYVSETYPRVALVNSNPNKLQNFVTVDDIRNALVHAYSGLVALGVFDDLATFASLLVVERNKQDTSRVDAFLPLEAVAALRVFAANATSFLQYPSN